jgi:hypothetical protein
VVEMPLRWAESNYPFFQQDIYVRRRTALQGLLSSLGPGMETLSSRTYIPNSLLFT